MPSRKRGYPGGYVLEHRQEIGRIDLGGAKAAPKRVMVGKQAVDLRRQVGNLGEVDHADRTRPTLSS